MSQPTQTNPSDENEEINEKYLCIIKKPHFSNSLTIDKFYFENSFQKIYYSFELGMRKPHPESFTHLLNENDLSPSKTLFIDDSEQHILGAQEAGLHSILLAPTLDVTSLFIDA